jgi:AcrR family transcriptional regulator
MIAADMYRADRHDERRRATSDALRQAAVARFARDGYERTSVAEIARDAGVTERTFYRHFPTKEAVLFQDYEHVLEWLRAALRMRPLDEPLLDSVLVAMRACPTDPATVRQAGLLRTNLIGARALHDHLRRVQDVFAHEITAHAAKRFAGRPDADFLATVAGNAIAGALIGSFETWAQRGAGDDLGDLTHRALDVLRQGIGEREPEPVESANGGNQR